MFAPFHTEKQNYGGDLTGFNFEETRAKLQDDCILPPLHDLLGNAATQAIGERPFCSGKPLKIPVLRTEAPPEPISCL